MPTMRELAPTQADKLTEIARRMNIAVIECKEHDTVVISGDWSTVTNEEEGTHTTINRAMAHEPNGAIPVGWIDELYQIIQDGEPLDPDTDELPGDYVQTLPHPGEPYPIEVIEMEHCESEEDEDNCPGCCYCALHGDERPTPPWQRGI